jgi:hypothetical protein
MSQSGRSRLVGAELDKLQGWRMQPGAGRPRIKEAHWPLLPRGRCPQGAWSPFSLSPKPAGE